MALEKVDMNGRTKHTDAEYRIWTALSHPARTDRELGKKHRDRKDGDRMLTTSLGPHGTLLV
jgi:hypothetical protein